MKKIVILLLAFTLCLALVSCDLVNNFMHEHAYGEWETKTAATCTEAEVEVRKCSCGAEETRVGDAAVDHNMVSVSDNTHHWTACSYDCGTVTEKAAHVATSIKAVCNKTDYVQGDVALAADFTVTATCECGASYQVSEGVVLENATLVSGANIVVVKLGELSSNVQINADKKVVVIDGSIVADTYVFSDKKNDPFHERETMGTHSGSFRVYLKYDFSKILADTYFADNEDDAKIQFTFTIVEGAYTDETSFSFGGFVPGEGVSDVDFADITWNAVKETDLGWSNATQPMDQLVGSHHVSFTETTLTLTFTYAQVKDYIDENGMGIFTFRAKQSGVKISSMEGVSAPTVKAIVDDSHLHAFNQRIESEQYFISAECGKQTYYYKSCQCGEHGDDFFKTEGINEHVYGEFEVTQAPTCTVEGLKTKTCSKCGDVQTETISVIAHSYNTVVTNPTCTEAGYTTYTCECGDTYTADEVAATGHTYGEWLYDESYHWQACACGDIANKTTHAGGEATETEKAVCDTCKQPYGGLASHVHNYNEEVTYPTCTTDGFTKYTCDCGDVYTGNVVTATGHTYGEWESASPATCEVDEVLVHYCACGANETGVGQAAFGHDMQTKYDENNHWTECAHNCGKATEAVAHFGGEATTTEQAVCEGCGQSYGELKTEESKDVVINGTIVQDTYITSDSSSGNKNFVTREEINCNNGKNFRPIFEFNLADALNNAEFMANKDTAKVEFTFAVSTGTADLFNETVYSIYGFLPGAGVSDVDFSTLTWNSCKDTGANSQFYRKDTNSNFSVIILNQSKDVASAYCTLNEVDGVLYITYTLDYNAIEHLVCTTAGDNYGDIVMGFDFNKSIKLASMESTKYAAPAVKVTYTK